jgi:hypothetical protein
MRIFITGNSRSGTTMMGRVLNLHSKVFTFKEIHFFEQLCASSNLDNEINREASVNLIARLLAIQRVGYLQYSDKNIQDYIGIANDWYSKEPNPVSPFTAYDRFLEKETEINGRQISCEQTPRNIFYIKEILDHNPNDKVIIMVRDIRDVLLSQKNKWKRKFLGAKSIPLKESFRAWINYHPFTIAKLWQACALTTVNYKNNPGVKIVKFEDLVSNPSEVISEICAFLGLEFEPQMLEVPKMGSSNRQDSNQKQGIDSTVLGKWKTSGLNSSEIRIVQKTAAKEMKIFGYQEVTLPSWSILDLYYFIIFPIKMGIALLMNLNRMRNIFETIKRRVSGTK